VTFPDAGGSMTAQTDTVTVTVNGDTDFEPDETVNVTLSALVGSGIFSDSDAVGTITNDDLAGSDFALTIFTPAAGNSSLASALLTGGILATGDDMGDAYGGCDYDPNTGTFIAINNTNGTLDTIDAARATVTTGPAVTGMNATATLFDIAYDSDGDRWIGIARNGDFDWFVYEINATTGAAVELASYLATGTYPLSIAIDDAGGIFGIFSNQTDFQDSLRTYDLGGSSSVVIGATGTVEGGWPIQPMDFDSDTGLLHAIHRYGVSNGNQEWGTFDTATGTWTMEAIYPATTAEFFWGLTVAKDFFTGVETEMWMMAD
ncbi:hypothetical protein, partial [Rhodopirellula baltica]